MRLMRSLGAHGQQIATNSALGSQVLQVGTRVRDQPQSGHLCLARSEEAIPDLGELKPLQGAGRIG
eukprot:3493487-Amphidinium_carterae.1